MKKNLFFLFVFVFVFILGFGSVFANVETEGNTGGYTSSSGNSNYNSNYNSNNNCEVESISLILDKEIYYSGDQVKFKIVSSNCVGSDVSIDMKDIDTLSNDDLVKSFREEILSDTHIGSSSVSFRSESGEKLDLIGLPEIYLDLPNFGIYSYYVEVQDSLESSNSDSSYVVDLTDGEDDLALSNDDLGPLTINGILYNKLNEELEGDLMSPSQIKMWVKNGLIDSLGSNNFGCKSGKTLVSFFHRGSKSNLIGKTSFKCIDNELIAPFLDTYEFKLIDDAEFYVCSKRLAGSICSTSIQNLVKSVNENCVYGNSINKIRIDLESGFKPDGSEFATLSCYTNDYNLRDRYLKVLVSATLDVNGLRENIDESDLFGLDSFSFDGINLNSLENEFGINVLEIEEGFLNKNGGVSCQGEYMLKPHDYKDGYILDCANKKIHPEFKHTYENKNYGGKKFYLCDTKVIDAYVDSSPFKGNRVYFCYSELVDFLQTKNSNCKPYMQSSPQTHVYNGINGYYLQSNLNTATIDTYPSWDNVYVSRRCIIDNVIYEAHLKRDGIVEEVHLDSTCRLCGGGVLNFCNEQECLDYGNCEYKGFFKVDKCVSKTTTSSGSSQSCVASEGYNCCIPGSTPLGTWNVYGNSDCSGEPILEYVDQVITSQDYGMYSEMNINQCYNLQGGNSYMIFSSSRCSYGEIQCDGTCS